MPVARELGAGRTGRDLPSEAAGPRKRRWLTRSKKSDGRGRQHVSDGKTVEYSYAPGETRHENYAAGQCKVHDLENIGEKEMIFMTVEFLDGANKPLALPAQVRPAA
jgi:hypothetical protein